MALTGRLPLDIQNFLRKAVLEAFGNIGPNGDADILIDGKDVLDHSGSHEPSVGEGTIIGRSRVIGYVILGNNVRVGDGTSIRGDEGTPLKIADNSNIGENDTFHSLNAQEISIGSNFKLGSKSVIHGPLTIGSDVSVGSSAVVFKSTIGNNVLIGDNAVVVGVRVPDGMVIPSGSMITLQKDVRKIKSAGASIKNSIFIRPHFSGYDPYSTWSYRITDSEEQKMRINKSSSSSSFAASPYINFSFNLPNNFTEIYCIIFSYIKFLESISIH